MEYGPCGAPWITLSCRDRNRVVLEQELAGLAHVGVAGVTLPLIAGVAVYTDERSAAVAEARELLAVPGVVGVNLSGLASARGEVFAAEVKVAVGGHLLGSTTCHPEPANC